jgi:sugar lactone lactonase YvrE
MQVKTSKGKGMTEKKERKKGGRIRRVEGKGRRRAVVERGGRCNGVGIDRREKWKNRK